MSKYSYIHFGDDVPEYNKLCRKEQYLEERDLANGVIHMKFKKFQKIAVFHEGNTKFLN